MKDFKSFISSQKIIISIFSGEEKFYFFWLKMSILSDQVDGKVKLNQATGVRISELLIRLNCNIKRPPFEKWTMQHVHRDLEKASDRARKSFHVMSIISCNSIWFRVSWRFRGRVASMGTWCPKFDSCLLWNVKLKEWIEAGVPDIEQYAIVVLV